VRIQQAQLCILQLTADPCSHAKPTRLVVPQKDNAAAAGTEQRLNQTKSRQVMALMLQLAETFSQKQFKGQA
jgi:hypothetical protein